MNERNRPEGFRFAHPIRVRWVEVDLQQIVFFGHYYAWFDMGMTEYFRNLRLPYPDAVVDAETDIFIKHSECDYQASARFDDELDIWTRVARLGHSSLVFECVVQRRQEVLVTGRLVYVFANPQSRQSKAIPANIRRAIERFEQGD